MNKTLNQIESELIQEITKCRTIVDGLKNNDAYKLLVGDFIQAANEIDNVWHLQQDLNRLSEMRITKLAAQTLIQVLDGYESSLNRAKEQLERLSDKDEA